MAIDKIKRLHNILRLNKDPNFRSYNSAEKVINFRENFSAFLEGKEIDIKPITIEIVPSLECPFKCPACTYIQNKSKLKGSFHKRLMTKKVFDRILKESKKIGAKSLIFTGGGEPSMNPQLTEWTQQAVNRNFKVGLYTNGLIYNEDKIRRLLSTNLSFVRISLNAGRSETHSRMFGYASSNEVEKESVFNKIIENIINFIKIKKKIKSSTMIGLGFLINEHNCSEFQEIFTLLDRIQTQSGDNLDYIAIRPEVCYFDENLKPIKKQPNAEIFRKTISKIQNRMIKKIKMMGIEAIVNSDGFRCLSKPHKEKTNIAASWSVSFNYDGKLYFASEFNGVKKYCIGDIKEESIEKIWYGKKRKALIKNIKTLPYFKLKPLNDMLLEIKKLGCFSEEETKKFYSRIVPKELLSSHDYFI